MTAVLKNKLKKTEKGSKKALVWNEESHRAFEGMKQALLSAVVLHFVDPERGSSCGPSRSARCWSKGWMMGGTCP